MFLENFQNNNTFKNFIFLWLNLKRLNLIIIIFTIFETNFTDPNRVNRLIFHLLLKFYTTFTLLVVKLWRISCFFFRQRSIWKTWSRLQKTVVHYDYFQLLKADYDHVCVYAKNITITFYNYLFWTSRIWLRLNYD